MSIVNAGLEEYRNAFFVLNEKLVAKQLVIEVKAIGGYAMLYNHLREGGFTVDVDTATKDYPPEVKELILDVSVEKGLEEDWLNNDAYNLPEVMEVLDELEWEEDKSFSNINLLIATKPSLLKLKMRAIHFGGLVPRITDKIDFLDLLKSLDISSIDDVKSSEYTKNMEKDYPRSFEFLREKVKW